MRDIAVRENIREIFCSIFGASVGLLCPAYRNQMRKILQSATRRVIVSLVLLRKYQGAAQNGRRVAHTIPKGGGAMRITLHIGRFTVTIIVKSKDRHSAK